MGYARETIVGYVSSLSGSTTFNALTANSNQSFTVRSFADGSECYLEDVWQASAAHPILMSIKSPRMHDDVLGIETASTPLGVGSSDADFNPQNVLPGYLQQQLYSTDVLSVTANGTSSDKMVGVFNVRYSNLGGVNGDFFTWNYISPLIKNLVGILVQPTASATVGVLGTGVALNSTSSRLKANVDYAILGYQTSIPVAAVVINGVNVGNLNVGGPGNWDISETGSFFVERSIRYNVPAIPCVNANNAGGTFISVADIVASTAPNVTLLMAELSQRVTGTQQA
jgi:hypothetical protein